VGNVSMNVYAMFRCPPLRIKKALGLFGTRLPAPKIKYVKRFSTSILWIASSSLVCLSRSCSGHIVSATEADYLRVSSSSYHV